MFKGYKIPLFIILLFSLLASRALFKPGYFPMHDDLQMMRQLELEKCFLDGQIPCRWVPDMGFGFGMPLFNFYPPLPYLIGEVFRLLGFYFTTTARLTFALSIFGSGVAMYYLAKAADENQEAERREREWMKLMATAYDRDSEQSLVQRF